MRGTLEICEDNDVERKLEILDDDVTEAIDLGIDAEHLRNAPNMVRECIDEQRRTIDAERVLEDNMQMKVFLWKN